MEIVLTEVLRYFNATSSLLNLGLSAALLTVTLISLYRACKRRSENKLSGAVLVGVSLIFFCLSLMLVFTYHLIFSGGSREHVNLLVNFGFSFVNVFITVTTLVVLGMYRGRL